MKTVRTANLNPLVNTGWLFGAQMLSGAAIFVATGLLARHLGPAVYGRWGFAYALVNLFTAAADMGLTTLAVRDLAREPGSTARYLAAAAAIKLASAVAVLAAIAALAGALSPDAESFRLCLLLGLQMVFASGTALLLCVFRAGNRTHLEAAGRVCQALTLAGVVVVSAVFDLSASTTAALYLAGTLAMFMALASFVAKRFVVRPRLEPAMVRSIFADAWPLALAIATTGIYYYFDSIFMGALGFRRDVGLYTAAYAPLLWVASVVGVLRAAFLPEQSRQLAGDGKPRRFLGFYGRVSLWLALPVAVFGVFYAREFLSIVYGGSYEDATFALQLLSLTGALMFLSSFYGSNLVIQGRRREYLVCVGAGAVVNVALNLWLIPAYRLDGAAAVTLLSEAAVMCCMWWQCRSILPLADSLSFLKAPVLASGLLVGVLLGTGPLLPAPLAIGIAGAVYLVAAARLGVLEAVIEAPEPARAA